jgi:hypothetical protein
MPAVAVIPAVLAFTGVSAAIGTTVAAAVGLGTIGSIAATAIGTGVVAGTISAAEGHNAGQVLQDAVIGGATSYIGGQIGQGISDLIGGSAGGATISDTGTIIPAANPMGLDPAQMAQGAFNATAEAGAIPFLTETGATAFYNPNLGAFGGVVDAAGQYLPDVLPSATEALPSWLPPDSVGFYNNAGERMYYSPTENTTWDHFGNGGFPPGVPPELATVPAANPMQLDPAQIAAQQADQVAAAPVAPADIPAANPMQLDPSQFTPAPVVEAPVAPAEIPAANPMQLDPSQFTPEPVVEAPVVPEPVPTETYQGKPGESNMANAGAGLPGGTESIAPPPVPEPPQGSYLPEAPPPETYQGKPGESNMANAGAGLPGGTEGIAPPTVDVGSTLGGTIGSGIGAAVGAGGTGTNTGGAVAPVSPMGPMHWGSLPDLALPGLNPGFIQAQPFYQTTSPVQAQYYWGNHPFINTAADLPNYNMIPNAPAQPWGLQQSYQPINLAQYLAALNQTGAAPAVAGPVAPPR